MSLLFIIVLYKNIGIVGYFTFLFNYCCFFMGFKASTIASNDFNLNIVMQLKHSDKLA